MAGKRRSTASKFTENEINDLVSRLQVLLPQVNQRGNSRNADKKCLCFGGQQSASEILQETCCHIRRLQKEVEQLSERLSELMDSVDISDIDRRTLQNFLQQ